jgi:hypothetical protein
MSGNIEHSTSNSAIEVFTRSVFHSTFDVGRSMFVVFHFKQKTALAKNLANKSSWRVREHNGNNLNTITVYGGLL